MQNIICNNRECRFRSKKPSKAKRYVGRTVFLCQFIGDVEIRASRDNGLSIVNPLNFECMSEQKTDEIKCQIESAEGKIEKHFEKCFWGNSGGRQDENNVD